MIDHLDRIIIAWLRNLTGNSWFVDYSILGISDNNLLKGALFLTALWWFWFKRSTDQNRNRTLVISALAAGLLAVAINQLLMRITPMRGRPYVADLPDVYFNYDLGIGMRNSFPSDHASLFFALATGLFFLNKRVGIIAWLYTIVVICIPRAYIGLHYPSDLFGGAVIGTFSACLLHTTRIREAIARPVLAIAEKYPGPFYATVFLFSYQLATLFDDLRDLGNWLKVVMDNFKDR